jgi:hypothetical protein
METTKISVNKTVGQIQGLLAMVGAVSVLIDYDAGQPSAISFKIQLNDRFLPFRLPCRWTALNKILKDRRKRIKFEDEIEEQAKRIAWRQILRWTEAQIALIETEMVRTEEVFLPYIQLDSSGRTLFEKIQEGNFKQLKE